MGTKRKLLVTKTGLARTTTVSAAILVVVAGALGAIRYGGICTLTLQEVFAACPLGYLERSLASRAPLQALWLPVGLVVLSVVLLGRVFCAWICPAGLVRRVLRIKARLPTMGQNMAGRTALSKYSPYAVLGGVLVASLVLRFPVFCFFCPVGLFFASAFAVLRLFSRDPLGVELVLFPLMFGIEILALGSWCRSFCPLGALLSLPSVLNRFFRPAIKSEACLTSKGINCQACKNACPEGVDLRNPKRGLILNDCTKCLECLERCPVKAIKIAALS